MPNCEENLWQVHQQETGCIEESGGKGGWEGAA